MELMKVSERLTAFSSFDIMNIITPLAVKNMGYQDTVSGGFRNDVWISRRQLNQDYWKLNKTWNPVNWSLDYTAMISTMTWEQTNAGFSPPIEEWVSCHEGSWRLNISIPCSNPRVKDENMFSPRRGHGAVVANNVLYIIGGRAQEMIATSASGAIVQGILDSNTQNRWSMREGVVLKNDIWVSEDGLGYRWKLISPGCIDPQLDVFLSTEVTRKQAHLVAGSSGAKCVDSSDCYGEGVCLLLEGITDKVCICPMFGPREHHSVSVQHRYFRYDDGRAFSEDYIYIVGGFTTVRYSFCSYNACGSASSYRLALEDAWVSNDGRKWIQLKPAISKSSNAKYQGRGAHASILLHSNPYINAHGLDKLWIFGGETSDPTNSTSLYLNDIWSVNLSTQPCCFLEGTCHNRSHPLQDRHLGVCLPTDNDWTEELRFSPWIGRSGHLAIHEPPSSQNQFRDLIYIIGGGNNDDALNDSWVWELENEHNWTKDFQDDQLYRIGNRGVLFRPKVLERSPYNMYFNSLSPIRHLVRQYLPITTNIGIDQSQPSFSKSLLSNKSIQILENMGIRTILDLSNADVYTILKLRGVDPSNSGNLTVLNICYLKVLSTSLLTKCGVNTHKSTEDEADISSVKSRCSKGSNSDDAYMDSQCVADHWDGCEPIEGYDFLNVHKVGVVPVPQYREDASKDLQDLHCQTIPQPRLFSAGAFYNGKVVIAGGKDNKIARLYQDVWYRDDTFPQSSIRTRPRSNSTRAAFYFDTNKLGSFLIEYKIFDTVERLDVTPWIATTTSAGTDLSWLDWKTGGPGNGWYTIYIRAVDSCGNRDLTYSQATNVYTWFYVSPLPWGRIIGLSILVLCILGYCYIEVRRRMRKKALERILLRQMKQKYKFQPSRDNLIISDKYSIIKRDFTDQLSLERSNHDIQDRSRITRNRHGYQRTDKVSNDIHRNAYDYTSSSPHSLQLNEHRQVPSTTRRYQRSNKVSNEIHHNAYDDTSSSPDSFQPYEHGQIPSNARDMDSRNLTYWDSDSSDSDSNARIRRRREIQHQGKLYSNSSRRYRKKRSNGKITPKKSV